MSGLIWARLSWQTERDLLYFDTAGRQGRAPNGLREGLIAYDIASASFNSAVSELQAGHQTRHII